MKLNEPIIAEFRHEATTTRKMLERVPQGSLSWKPHEKSRTLGEIAAHIANLPGVFIIPLSQDKFDRNTYTLSPKTVPEILETFERNISGSLDVLGTLTDEKLLAPWRFMYGERLVFEQPRLVVAYTVGINHIVHHRGQLSVYLRLLNIPLPPLYGPTADES
jgi:uncharacterized damage-inducible protein DinB